MFKLFKKKPVDVPAELPVEAPVETSASVGTDAVSNNQSSPSSVPSQSIFGSLKQRLSSTRSALGLSASSLKALDMEQLAKLEEILLKADVGYATTEEIINRLKHAKQQAAGDAADNAAILKSVLLDILTLKPEPSATTEISDVPPISNLECVLVVGVNGSGKTTSVAKLAHRYKKEGKKVLLAAADTFRAAAVEQLAAWGERNEVAVVTPENSTDPASVAYTAVQTAKSQGYDCVIIDTAGRLHTQSNLMEELKKVKRVIGKLDASLPTEVLMVLDASIGQNTINQLAEFNAAVGVTGLIVTKLDGTAKGGIMFALSLQFQLPLCFIGIGEQPDDLIEFDAEDFVESIITS